MSLEKSATLKGKNEERIDCMQLEGKKVIALVDKDFEDLEHWYPVYRLREAGAQVDLVGPEANETYFGKYGVPAKTDYAFSQINPESYDAILIPGGWAPDTLRRYEDVLHMVKHMDQAKKPIGHICHAGWVLVSADVLHGRTVTSTPGIKDDMINAGAEWIDEPVVVDGHIISSRRPADMPDYLRAFIKVLAK